MMVVCGLEAFDVLDGALRAELGEDAVSVLEVVVLRVGEGGSIIG